MLYLLLMPVIVIVIWIITPNRPSKLRLMGAHVLVTGGSSGIGLEIAKECARQGAFITIVARNSEKLEKAKHEIELCMQLGGERQCVIALSLDISSSAKEVAEGIKQAEEKLGPVDALINCAGVSHAQIFEDTPVEKFEWLMRINYLGSVFCIKAVLPGMKQRRKGRIVIVSSQAGQIGLFGYTGYSASKFALRGLAEALQMEVKPFGIAITVSYPPDTDTPGFHLEDETKPEETRLISETSGLFSADVVARSLVRDMVRGEFQHVIGLDGFMLGHLCAGMSPTNSSVNAFVQILLMGAFRLIALTYMKSFDSIVRRCAGKSRACNDKDQ